MANKGAKVPERRNKKGTRSAPESEYYCNHCGKYISASGLPEFRAHKAACLKQVEARRREAARREAARREANN